MRTNTLPAILFALIVGMGIFLSQVLVKEREEREREQEEEGGIPLRDRMDLAWEQEFEMTVDPALGYVPKERLLKAWEYIKSHRFYGKAAISGITWQERGPNNCGGRTRSMLIDLNDGTRKTLWAGSVAGGLWKTTDITLSSPTWTPVNEFFSNLAITTIAQSPANPQIMLFGTGEGNGNSDATRGLGVWKSTNGGGAWTQLSATNNSNFYYCNKIFCLGQGDTIFVATTTGLWRSVNSGTSFTKVLGSGISSAGGNITYDIERAYNGTLYASLSNGSSGTGTIHRSYNSGATWSTPLSVDSSITKREIELALAENDTNVIWGLVENGSRIKAIIRSTNAGATFDTTASHPIDADAGVSVPGANIKDFSRAQGWYDLSIAVDPNNASVCFVGAIDLFKTSTSGASWQQISHWYGGFTFQEVHADQHSAMFSPGSSSIIYFSNDGGVWRSANATATIPTISSRSANYNTTQFYACAMHPTAGSNQFLAGAQDNGSHGFSSTGINATTEVTGGDGAFCHIDQDQPQYWFSSYVYNSYYTSTNTGASFSGSLNAGSTGRFINPSDYDDAKNRMYLAYKNDTFLRWNNPQAVGNNYSLVPVPAFNDGMVSAVKVSPNVSNRVYFGTGGGRIVKVDSAHTSAPIDTCINVGKGMPTTYVSCIEIETGNDNHILVTYSNYGVSSIWETKNGGTTWTNIEGNFISSNGLDIPVRWILLNPSKSWQAMIATELGVWSTDSIQGTSTNWQASNSGLANVRVDMLQVRTSDMMVTAATHGRGLYSSDVFVAPTVAFAANKVLAYIGAGIQFTQTCVKATSYLWNFGDGTTSTAANPLKVYSNAGAYNVSLTINSGAVSLMKTAYIQIMPYRGIPYTLAQGGDMETNASDFGSETVLGVSFQRGSSSISGKSGTKSGSNAWVTGLTASTYSINNDTRLYTSSFNFTAAGTYTFKFWAKNIFELNYDGYRVEYSTDSGTTWLPLGTTTSSGWYDYANTGTGRPFPQNQAFFNATRSSFTQMTYNVSSLAGNNDVCFRIIFKSDASTNAAGLAIDDIEITGPANNALPVALLSFTGTRISSDEVILEWKTASEKSNLGFELERKLTPDATFEKIAFIAGKGNTDAASYYSQYDANGNTRESYYRLKQVDQDGTYTYSPVAVVDGSLQKRQRLVSSLIPDAAGSAFRVTIHSEEPLTVQLISNTGQSLRSITVINGSLISLQDVAAGIYYLRFMASTGEEQTEKVFVR